MSDYREPCSRPCPQTVFDLIGRFELHADAYRRQEYNETQVRREFIDPLFKSLGWDVDNESGHAETYKDVIHEDAINVGGSTKAPDYCFRIGSVRKFFVEAKKPSVSVGGDPAPAYQLRRYAWTAKLPLSIVTDFEEFAVYDCRIKPRPDDKTSTARVLYLKCDEYPNRWDEIASIFSKDAILKGSFDKYAESNKRKRGTAEVDDEFLKEIETWRDELARNIALRNPALSVRDLNYAVGKTIDRIIFLRMCEDRGVETYAQLRLLLNGPRVYPRLVEIFHLADERYNSGLFHFEPEKNRHDEPDTLTPNLTIDDRVLKDIIKGLYYPDCSYEFSVMPPEILGQVYEQFLGKVIRLTKGHQAIVEEKAEVKKAGGVYYTPKYIVDYIVEHTVGELLKGKTPAEVGPMLDQSRAVQARGHTRTRARNDPSRARNDPSRAREEADIPSRARNDPSRAREEADIPSRACKEADDASPLTKGGSQGGCLRILDPACGSGSFLLGAYQTLLDWHLRWYIDNDPKKHAKKKNSPIYQSGSRGWQPTIAEKKRILLNHIYGVDIDPQAVEVTKLSLLLKVLEGESAETIGHTLRLFHERALPDLAGNIKCGNSLIGPDFYDNQQLSLLDEEERYRINVFDWHAEFPDIMCAGGFDAVVGNPPWGQKEIEKDVRVADYLRYNYQSVGGIFDLFRPFVEKGIALTRNGGRFGMVLPDIVLLKDYKETRRLLLDKIAMDRIDWWGMAFSQAIIDAATITGCRTTARPDHVVTATVRERERTFLHHIAQADFARNERLTFNLLLTQDKREVLNRLSDRPKLGDYFEIHEGVHSGNIRDELFVPRKLDRSCRELLFGRDEIVPYVLSWHGKFIRLSALPQQRLRSRYANAGQANWYDREKLLVRRTGDFVLAAVDPEKRYASNNFFIVFPVRPFDLDLYGLCAVLNSHFMTWYFRTIEPRVGRVFAELKIKHLRTFPLPAGDAASKACRQLNELGRARWDAGRRLASAQTPHQKETFARERKAIDKRIETLVLSSYELDPRHCGLIEKEISDAQKKQDVA